VARVASKGEFGADRYSALKVEKSYNALRLLFLVENLLYLQIKHQNKKLPKKDKKSQRKNKYIADMIDKEEESAGYPQQDIASKTGKSDKEKESQS
jgi:hypothetical protein